MLVNEFFSCGDALKNLGFSVLSSCQLCKCFHEWKGGARGWSFSPQWLLIVKGHSREDSDIRWVIIIKNLSPLSQIVNHYLKYTCMYEYTLHFLLPLLSNHEYSCLCKLYLEVGSTNICCNLSLCKNCISNSGGMNITVICNFINSKFSFFIIKMRKGTPVTEHNEPRWAPGFS